MHIVNAAVLEQWIALSDKQVVADVLAGHTALFELLMRRHNERVYRAARAIVRNEAEAEDVMQQSYVNAYAHLRQFNGQAHFSTWLTSPERETGSEEFRVFLESAIDRLPNGAREVFVLREVEGMPNRSTSLSPSVLTCSKSSADWNSAQDDATLSF